MLKAVLPCCQVLIQGLQNLNRAVHQDVVAVQLLPRNQWVAPSSVVLQDEGPAKDDSVEEEDEENVVNLVSVEEYVAFAYSQRRYVLFHFLLL